MEYKCKICGNFTTWTDKICMNYHILKPAHIPNDHYDKYFKLLAKKGKE